MSEFMQALHNRRSLRLINSECTMPDETLMDLLRDIIKNTPTAFNMQSTRAVLLLGEAHHTLWMNIVFNALKPQLSQDALLKTEKKLSAFAAGHGTILFFDDEGVTRRFMEENPFYADSFLPWALQQNGMLQYAVWTALSDAGLGASLQHYNPVIDEDVKAHYNLPDSWKLWAQMPFGIPTAGPDEKEFEDIGTRFFVRR